MLLSTLGWPRKGMCLPSTHMWLHDHLLSVFQQSNLYLSSSLSNRLQWFHNANKWTSYKHHPATHIWSWNHFLSLFWDTISNLSCHLSNLAITLMHQAPTMCMSERLKAAWDCEVRVPKTGSSSHTGLATQKLRVGAHARAPLRPAV